ncbi:MAG: SMI1/KNR4 family protein [Novosphingobium sp.]
MNGLTDKLLARVAERANDPKRRYMTAAEDEARVELPVAEIERREEEWTRRLLVRSNALEGNDMAPEDVERYMDEWRVSRDAVRDQMDEQIRAWGQTPRQTKSLIETEHYFRVSSEPPGAKPLRPGPSESDWKALEQIAGRPMPEDLKRLYTVSDGGFGPGFTGLNPVQLITAGCEDFRRRGPDYCGTIDYPNAFLPLATADLDYHYDLDTGRIISSNSRWEDQGLEAHQIYEVAFGTLAEMMEDWLSRS